MTIKLHNGDWFERDGQWFYWSADGSREIGPFKSEDEAKNELVWDAQSAMFDE